MKNFISELRLIFLVSTQSNYYDEFNTLITHYESMKPNTDYLSQEEIDKLIIIAKTTLNDYYFMKLYMFEYQDISNTVTNVLSKLTSSDNEQVHTGPVTYESNPAHFIYLLEQDIENAKPDVLKTDDIENVSDHYQAALEYSWWRQEQLAEIIQLKSKLTPRQLVEYNKLKS